MAAPKEYIPSCLGQCLPAHYMHRSLYMYLATLIVRYPIELHSDLFNSILLDLFLVITIKLQCPPSRKSQYLG